MSVNVESIAPVQETAAAPVAGLASLLDLLRSASEQDRAAFAAALNLAPVAAAPAKKSAGRPKKAAAAAVSLPEAGEDGAPSAEDYRLKEEEINADTCQARRLNGGEDKRWKPAVYRESQCGGKTVEGSNLCEICTRRLQRYVAAPSPKADWTGLVTEEPLDWVHMLGTDWATGKPPKWLGVVTSASGSEASSEAGEVAAAPKVSRAEAAAAKAQERAQATIARAQKKADEAAAKALKKAEEAAAKAAAKAAEKAAKAAEKKASKPASKPAASSSAAAAAVAPTQEAAASTASAPVDVVGELKLIDGTFYMIKDGDVFEYDTMTEVTGKRVGELTEDGESIKPVKKEEEEEEEDVETPIAE
jgi:hypothetical protein